MYDMLQLVDDAIDSTFIEISTRVYSPLSESSIRSEMLGVHIPLLSELEETINSNQYYRHFAPLELKTFGRVAVFT